MCCGCKMVDFPITPAVTASLRKGQSQNATDGICECFFPICTVVVLQRLCGHISVKEQHH